VISSVGAGAINHRSRDHPQRITYRFHPDDVAADRDLERLVGALAHDGELDFGVHRAAHLIDGLV